MMETIVEILPPACLLVTAVGYASALTFSKTENAKLGFFDSLFRLVGEMPDPFYRC